MLQVLSVGEKYSCAILHNLVRLFVSRPWHPASSIKYAMFTLSQGGFDEAKQLRERCLAIHEKALGADHPDVAMSLMKVVFLSLKQVNHVAGIVS